jgi:hypothetical protein
MSFKRLDPEDFLISADSITAPAWSGNAPTLTEFYTSSVQASAASGDYYLSIYQTGSTLSNAATQFNIAFGDSAGSGSLLFNSGIDGKSPTSTIFGQFQNIVLGDESTTFTFGDVTPVTQSFYVLTIDRTRYKEKLFPGTMDLRLISESSVIRLTDNSNDVSVQTFNEAGRVFQLVSGSNGAAISLANSALGASVKGQTVSGSYGYFLPDIGTILLNASALDLPYASGGVDLSTNNATNTDVQNPAKLFNAISGATSFTLNSEETITSGYMFVRARNAEFNYSENPSFITGSTGTVLYTDFINAPEVFATTVGLYNDNNELLATAKLSRPLKKNFTKEALVRIKLDF